MSVSAFPLAWPHGRPRTPEGARKFGQFRSAAHPSHHWRTVSIDISDAGRRLVQELDRIGAREIVVSTNRELRRDGYPRAGLPEPTDPGVAVYFQLKGTPIVLACDRYTRVAANMAAIAAHIDATRTIERHGVGSLEQLFAGFLALPAPSEQPWRLVLRFDDRDVVTRDMILQRRRQLARLHHADAGGSGSRMAEINAAADEALRECAP